jgi:hypothetical protein
MFIGYSDNGYILEDLNERLLYSRNVTFHETKFLNGTRKKTVYDYCDSDMDSEDENEVSINEEKDYDHDCNQDNYESENEEPIIEADAANL